ncbi:type IV secretory system conjugative DNA transfer family protein [Nocardioides glacieisoli]|nr:DUF87 domain-containing protein [Nocardioides glacieisoli]
MSANRRWLRLDLPEPLTSEQVHAALTGLCSLSGSPQLVLEARGGAHTVRWRIGSHRRDTARVRDVLKAHLPRLHPSYLDHPITGNPVDAAVNLRYAGSRLNPLQANAEVAARGLLAALARAGKHETVTLQIILGPRWRPSREPDEPIPGRRQIRQKWSEPRYSCHLRIGAEAPDPARTRSLINSVASSARALQSPGVQLRVTRTSADGFAHASPPWWWRSELTPTDLIALAAWPIGAPPLPGVPASHPRRLYPNQVLPRSGRVLGFGLSDDQPRRVAMKTGDNLRHLHVLGPTGVGKSTLLAHLARQDIEAGLGVAVIDPKGDLTSDLLARIPEARRDDVVVLDPADDAPVGLASLSGDPDRAADSILHVFHSLYADNWGPRTHDILHASLLTLARRGDASLPMIPTLLTHSGFRRSVTGAQVQLDPMGLGSFWSWYESISEAERHAAIAPVMNKLRPILLRPGMRHVLGQRAPRFELSDVFTKRQILLINLGKGRLGPEAAQLLGSIVVSLLWTAAQSRTAVAADKRRPVHLYIDEVQDYLRLPGDLGDALAQARGLGVGFTLAHQHLGQLSPAIRDAVMANARSRIMFQLSARDARDLARTSRDQVEPIDLESLPAFHAYASLLVDGTPAPWVSLRTTALGPASADIAALRARSSRNYGVPATETDAILRGLIEQPPVGQERIGRTARRSDGGAS